MTMAPPAAEATPLRHILDSINQAVVAFDDDFRLMAVNRQFIELLGLPQELGRIGTPLEALFRHNARTGVYGEGDVDAQVGALMEHARAYPAFVRESRRPNGTVLEIHKTSFPGGFVLTYIDVTERKQREAALREQSRTLEAILENMAQGVNIIDGNLRVLVANDGFLEIYGLPKDLARPGAHIAEIIRYLLVRGRHEIFEETESADTDDIDSLVERQVDALGKLKYGETRLYEEVAPDGRIIEVRHKRLESGVIVSTYTDISERVAAEQELQAREERFRAVVDDQSEFISRFTPDYRMTFVNRALADRIGGPRKDIIGTRVLDLMTPEQQVRFVMQLSLLTPENPTVRYEMEAPLPDGSMGWEAWTDRALFDADGRLMEYQSVGRDITERKRAEAELREREERFRAIAEGVPIPLGISSLEDNSMLYVNARAHEVFGLTHGADRKTVDRAWPDPRDRERLLDELRRTGRVSEREVMLRRADGTPFWALISAVRMKYAGITAVLTMTTDITERLRMEQALRASEARLKAFMENAPVGMYLKDQDGRYVLANPEMSRVFGRPADQMIGRTPADVADLHDIAAVERHDRAVMETGQPVVAEEFAPALDAYRWAMVIRFPFSEAEGEVTHIGGFHVDITPLKEAAAHLSESERRFRTIALAHPVPALISQLPDRKLLFVNEPFTRLTGYDEQEIAEMDRSLLYADRRMRDIILDRLQAQGSVDGDEVLARRKDGSVFPVALYSRLFDYQGERAMVTNIVDLTEKKRTEAEISRQRAALHQSEKLSALGTLLADVAHELNNPLTVVAGQSQLLEATSDDPRVQERAERIRAAATRCARIVKTFLSMARQRPPAHRAVDAAAAVQAACELAAYALRTSDVVVEQDLPPGLPPCWADPDQLGQVLVNLVVNAQQALFDRPAPRTIRVSARPVAEEAALEITVEDNGPGIPEDLRERIFEPFFTTKPDGIGTGIGLAICRSIIISHGGRLDLGGSPLGGAAFTLRLPTQSGAEDAAPESVDAPPWSKALRILVIDDEPEIVTTLAEILVGDGHEVVTAASGTEALEILGSEQFDVVLSDIRMPELDGQALFDRLQSNTLQPPGRIGFVTGAGLGDGVVQFLNRTGAPWIEKPFTPEDIRSLVERIMRGPD